MLVAGYTVLAVAAGARSGVQLATRLDDAPVPYLLSAAAAATYLAVGWALRAGRHRGAAILCAVELAGVLLVGTWSVVAPAAFPDETVWSGYGVGYGLTPLLLPAAVLLWFHRRYTLRGDTTRRAP
ncbi:MAG: hypothetical protein ACRC35_02120 [Angustibacter sp.]